MIRSIIYLLLPFIITFKVLFNKTPNLLFSQNIKKIEDNERLRSINKTNNITRAEIQKFVERIKNENLEIWDDGEVEWQF